MNVSTMMSTFGSPKIGFRNFTIGSVYGFGLDGGNTIFYLGSVTVLIIFLLSNLTLV